MLLDWVVLQSSIYVNVGGPRLKKKERDRVNDACSRPTHRGGLRIHRCSWPMPWILWHASKAAPTLTPTQRSVEDTPSNLRYTSFLQQQPFAAGLFYRFSSALFLSLQTCFPSFPPFILFLIASSSTFQKTNCWCPLHLTILSRLYLDRTQSEFYQLRPRQTN